jgi:hypothetical protein
MSIFPLCACFISTEIAVGVSFKIFILYFILCLGHH